MPDLSDDDLLAELGVSIEAPKARKYSPREERIIAGFEDILRFFDEHGRLPQHGEENDIFERLYAVRLDRLRSSEECRSLLEDIDRQGFLSGVSVNEAELDDEDLLAELGVDAELEAEDIRVLRHVQTAEERRAAEEVASREKCADFDKFDGLFKEVQAELDAGQRSTRPFELKAEIRPGAFFIVGGQKAYVAEMGELTITPQGRSDARLRVIFDNGTESNMLMRSLQRALNKDDAGRRVTEPEAGPLFGDDIEEGDQASGTIYVLRSKSDHPVVSAHRDIVHKIGVTNMPVKQRIAGARLQPTFLMADVEVIAEYQLYNISRSKLERVIHRVFGAAQLDIEVADRFGRLVKPREWFMVPLSAINDAIDKISDGTITGYRYDTSEGALAKS